ncbi:hypothetical protein GW17_00057683, partial [Ensete ventricosum]
MINRHTHIVKFFLCSLKIIMPLLLIGLVRYCRFKFKVSSLWCPLTGLASNALTSKLAFSGAQVLVFLISLSLDMDLTILWMAYVEDMRTTLASETWKTRTTICWGMRDRWLSYDGVEE